ncbi:hypothetical protein RB594_000637 [Gaeumannomyces avenae]
MDAQNAVEAASRKHVASPKPVAPEPNTITNHPNKNTATANNEKNNHIKNNNSSSNSIHSKPSLSRKSPAAVRASPNAKDPKPPAPAPAHDDDGGTDANSEAETIVLAGKDDRSPIKARKAIKHEARSDGEHGGATPVALRKQSSTIARDARDGVDSRSRKSTPARDSGESAASAFKRKRLHGGPDGVKPRVKPEQCSSGLSSAPASPPHQQQQAGSHNNNNGRQQQQQQQQQPQQPPRRRRLSATRSAASDSESIRARSPKPPGPVAKEKHRPTDRLVPHKRKAPKAESEDESESHKARRQRTSAIDKDMPKPARDSNGGSYNNHGGQHNNSHHAANSGSGHAHSKSSAKSHHHDSQAAASIRSVSPPPRAHRRSISTQLPPSQSSNGLSHKKKRIPAPLQSTDYHSDDSSPGDSPRIRGSKLRSLATPATTEANMSPAKFAPHKKHLDAHGQTFLARACARGEYDTAKQRLGERPEDLNVADFAGNTPLQIASINGFEDIVNLLIEAGCALDCVNYDKDTPLLDAVENGHVEVVKLLLDAGVNPRKANVNGEEPLDRITDETDNADEIRRLLVEAKQRAGERRRTSEEHNAKYPDGRDSHGPESPRHSPATGNPHAGSSSGRRAGTVRATKTSNHLLYMPMDDKTLRQAAGRGDEETVTRILQVRDGFDDPESMVAAARGGHDMIINLLLALGNANPDPGPVTSMPPEFATPMLAAIGQENIKVVELLLTQGNFDPTRKFKHEAYHEIARRRQGPNWKEEEHMLKDAYDAHRKSHKETGKTKSPAARDPEKDSKRLPRSEVKEEPSKLQKRKLSSPATETKKTASGRPPASPKEKRRPEPAIANRDDPSPPKRGSGRLKEDRLPTIAVPDRDLSPASSKQLKPKRTEPDISAVSSEGEAVKPRRKLISGKDLKGEREKQRRASMVSTASSLKEPSSPRDGRDESSEKPKLEKFMDRTKQLKRDESRDRLSVSSEGSTKRHRSSATPPHASSEKDGENVPIKRRRLDVDGKEKKPKITPSPDDRQPKSAAQRDVTTKARRDHDAEDRTELPKNKKLEVARARKDPIKAASVERSIHVKSEDVDVEMRDASQPAEEHETQPPQAKPDSKAARAESESRPVAQAEARAQSEARAKAEAQARADAQAKAEADALEEAKRKEEEEDRRLAEEEKRKQKEERDRRRREEEERRQREADEAEKRLKAEQEERERKRKEEEERRRLAEEEKRREEDERKRLEEEKRRKEEEEQKRQEEEEKRRQAEAEARRLRELEEERKRLEEEERKRQEQLEREAAEEARRKEEEEERRKEQERVREAERRRAAREAEQRRVFLEQEARRLDRLPPLLRWLDRCANPKSPEIAQKFSTMQGVRYDCIRPEATGTPGGREQWLLNTQVALLLGEKDLELSRYTAWERVPVSRIAKIVIWRLESDRYAMTTPNLYDLGLQLPGYYDGEDPEKLAYRTVERLRQEAMERFLEMDMFFVKASELMFIVPNIPHLSNIRLAMAYRELPEDESLKWESCQKWKIDPDANRFYGFAPRKKYYLNGVMVEEQMPGLSAVSKTPFPEHRVPRRGTVMIPPDDPEYARHCKDQGLEHLLEASHPTPSPLVNGASSPPTIATSASTARRLSTDESSGDGPRTTALVNGTAHSPDVSDVSQNPRASSPLSPRAMPATTIVEPRQDPQPLVNDLIKDLCYLDIAHSVIHETAMYEP